MRRAARRPAPARRAAGPRRRRPGLIGLATAAAVIGLVALAVIGFGVWTFGGRGPAAREGRATTVVLERGSGLSSIANALENAGVIRSAPLFMAATQARGAAGELKAGEYAFASGASMAQVLDAIRNGTVVRHFVTVPEGVTSEAVVDILMASPVLTGAVAVPAEGTLLPETYDVQRGEDRAAVLARMTAAHDRELARLWEARDRSIPVRTPQEAVILASVVEKETGLAAERPKVAAVFVNRLRQGMRLESDPTVVYGITGGRPQGRGLLRSELGRLTPYNTYLIPGLPPGPITNPGRASLAAVMNPPKTSSLFFVADGTGGHVFADTFEDHLKNVARWRAVEAERAREARGEQPEPVEG